MENREDTKNYGLEKARRQLKRKSEVILFSM